MPDSSPRERCPVRLLQAMIFSAFFIATCGWAEASDWVRAFWIVLTGALAASFWSMWWRRA